MRANRATRRAWLAAVRKSNLPRETKRVAEWIGKGAAEEDGIITDPSVIELLRLIDDDGREDSNAGK
jgi:hypothetical protein